MATSDSTTIISDTTVPAVLDPRLAPFLNLTFSCAPAEIQDYGENRYFALDPQLPPPVSTACTDEIHRRWGIRNGDFKESLNEMKDGPEDNTLKPVDLQPFTNFPYKRDHLDETFGTSTGFITAPVLLYRALCTFPESMVVCGDRYKSVWEGSVLHKSTGRMVHFGEHKGHSGVHVGDDPTGELRSYLHQRSRAKLHRRWLDKEKSEEVPENPRLEIYLTDMVLLINYLISDQCVHPYANVLAGCAE